MNSELGIAKATHWRECGLVPWQPDSLTGSTDPAHIEWGVPHNWASMSMADLRKLTVKATGDATEEDAVNLNDVAALTDLPEKEKEEEEEEKPEVKIKEEPKDEAEEHALALKQRIDSLLKSGPAVLREYQDKCLEAKVLRTKAENSDNKHTQSFVTDLGSHVNKIQRLLKILEILHVRDARAEGIAFLAETDGRCADAARQPSQLG